MPIYSAIGGLGLGINQGIENVARIAGIKQNQDELAARTLEAAERRKLAGEDLELRKTEAKNTADYRKTEQGFQTLREARESAAEAERVKERELQNRSVGTVQDYVRRKVSGLATEDYAPLDTHAAGFLNKKPGDVMTAREQALLDAEFNTNKDVQLKAYDAKIRGVDSTLAAKQEQLKQLQQVSVVDGVMPDPTEVKALENEIGVLAKKKESLGPTNPFYKELAAAKALEVHTKAAEDARKAQEDTRKFQQDESVRNDAVRSATLANQAAGLDIEKQKFGIAKQTFEQSIGQKLTDDQLKAMELGGKVTEEVPDGLGGTKKVTTFDPERGKKFLLDSFPQLAKGIKESPKPPPPDLKSTLQKLDGRLTAAAAPAIAEQLKKDFPNITAAELEAFPNAKKYLAPRLPAAPTPSKPDKSAPVAKAERPAAAPDPTMARNWDAYQAEEIQRALQPTIGGILGGVIDRNMPPMDSQRRVFIPPRKTGLRLSYD